MIDHKAIIKELEEKKLTQQQIADKCGCSIKTVTRIAKQHHIGVGQGVKNFWEFKETSIQIAYLIGSYITDGWVTRTNKMRLCAFGVTGTSIEYIDKVYQYMYDCGLNPKYRDVMMKGKLGKRQQYEVVAYSSLFSKWLHDVCNKKSKIPDFLFDDPIDHQMAFLSAAIDGDGHVSKTGNISIRGVDDWLKQLPDLLQKMGIRTSGYKVDRVLESGKIYGRVTINREDFRNLKPQCVIPHKIERILHAADNRGFRGKRKRYECESCHQFTKTRQDAKYCRKCYLQSERFFDHLKTIAPSGNKAGNAARWKHK